jgi:hypothetical protein
MKFGKRWGLGVGAGVCGALGMLLACSGSNGGTSAKPSGPDGGGPVPSTGGAGNGRGAGGGGASSAGGISARGGAAGSVITPADGGDVPDPAPNVLRSSKVDLLLVIDNSISMADKQQALKSTIPDLVNRLTAAGSGVTDLHVGIISSSLGDHGNDDVCFGKDGTGNLRDEEINDHGHLITTRPRAAALGIPEVIAWDSTKSPAALTKQIQDVVFATGEFGCGFESQLEAAYRFLADPKPPQAIVKAPCTPGTAAQCAFPQGVDTTLLAQRAAFLRPDSAVAVMMLTDENDCSIREERQYFYAATSPSKLLLPHGTAVCKTNPNDPCCYSCATAAPPSCPTDPTCTTITGTLQEDQFNLRCFHQKQRFGLDFLYPVERYVTAFTRPHLCTSSPDLVPNATTCKDADGDGMPDLVANPLFYGPDGAVRAPSLVYVLGLVGVPWQDLAQGGASAATLALKTPSALAADGTWTAILGNGAASPPIDPTDALMIESRSPRSGKDVTGASIPGPQVPLSGNNAMNGHDWANTANDDLQYACIFPLPAARDCLQVEQASPAPGCNCGSSFNPADFDPVCQSPTTGTYGNTQYFAKAYPGIRELSLLRALGSQGLTASVCPKNLTDTAKSDYGYRPAIDLLLGELKRVAP